MRELIWMPPDSLVKAPLHGVVKIRAESYIVAFLRIALVEQLLEPVVRRIGHVEGAAICIEHPGVRSAVLREIDLEARCYEPRVENHADIVAVLLVYADVASEREVDR